MVLCGLLSIAGPVHQQTWMSCDLFLFSPVAMLDFCWCCIVFSCAGVADVSVGV